MECERPLVYNKMLRLTFDVGAAALLGLDPEREGSQRLVSAFYNLVSNIFCIPLRIPGLGFSKVSFSQSWETFFFHQVTFVGRQR